MAEEKKEYNVGWLWVVAIVVIVAIVLYVNQKTTAPETGVTPEEQTAVTEEVTEEAVVAEFGDYGVEFSYVPEAVPVGAQFGVDWKITAPEANKTRNTGLYFGTTSREIAPDTNPTPKEVGYPGETTGYIGVELDVPGEYESVIPAYTYATTIYVRAHAEVDGVHYWSEEKQIVIE